MVSKRPLNTVGERSVTDVCDGVGDSDAGQTAAAIERPFTDVSDRVGDSDAGQAAASYDKKSWDPLNAVSNIDC